MKAFTVIELDPFSDASLCLRSGFPDMQVNTLVFHGAPQPIGPGEGRELVALIGVHDLGRAEPSDCLVQRLDAKVRLQRARDTLGQNLPRVPIHDRNQMQEPAPHRQIDDVGGPDLVGPGRPQTAQQVGIGLVSLRRPAGFWLLVYRIRSMRRISRLIRFSFTRWPLLPRCQVICLTPKNGVSRNCSPIRRTSARFSAVSPLGGPVPFLCRPKCSFRPLSVRKRPGFSNPVLSAVVADCRNR